MSKVFDYINISHECSISFAVSEEFRVYITRSAAIGRIAGDVFKLTVFLAARAGFRWGCLLDSIAALFAFPERIEVLGVCIAHRVSPVFIVGSLVFRPGLVLQQCTKHKEGGRYWQDAAVYINGILR